MKRKFCDVPVVISDSDSDWEAENAMVKAMKAKIDQACAKSKRRRVDVQGKKKEKDQPELSKSASTMKIKVEPDVDSEDGGHEEKKNQDVCQVVKVEPPIVVPSYSEVVIVEHHVPRDEVKQDEVSNPQQGVIVISSDEDGSALDDSFSQNQEGSRKVQDLLHQQELGKTKK